jgi:hypothetical protein
LLKEEGILIVIWALIMIVAIAVIVFLVQRLSLNERTQRRLFHYLYGRLAAGALVVASFASLPWIGWLVQLLVLVSGLGALILERKELRTQFGG